MACFSLIFAISCLFTGAESFAPIQWAKTPGKRLALMPNSFVGHHLTSYALPQKLTIGETSSTMVPYFTAKPDNTISVAGWCIEAAGEKCGDAVLVNNCDGGPAQQWNWIPDAYGRNLIQLKDSNLCFDVNDEGSLNGASVELQHCENKASETWLYEAPLSVPGEGALFTSDARHVMLTLMALAGVGALSLRAWFFGSSKTFAVADGVPLDQDLEFGNSLVIPSAFHEGTPARSQCARRGVIRMNARNEEGIHEGAIVFGKVIGYNEKKRRWHGLDEASARVRIEYIVQSRSEQEDPLYDRPVDFKYTSGSVVATLPKKECSFLIDFGERKPIHMCVEKNRQEYFEVLKVSSDGDVVVSMVSYLQSYYNILLQSWARVENYEYAYVRKDISPGIAPHEALVEAERLAREDFELSLISEPDFDMIYEGSIAEFGLTEWWN